jgi:phage terminase large subunit GpA-like protein
VNAHRVPSGKASGEPGPYRTARTPYLKQIMDCLSASHPAQKVIFQKGAQIGGSEAGCNWIGYLIHHSPGPVLVVQPTVEMAERFSKQRIEPMIESTPVLRERVKPARSRDSGNAILQKDFAGGTLVLTGANSAVGLRSMPARALMLDEIDAYPSDVGAEGDPIELAIARTKTFGYRRKIYLCSTPKLASTSRIEREYENSDQRRFYVPCKHCSHMQVLRFENLRWEKGKPDTAAYHCESCGAASVEGDKPAMLAGGEWRATATASDPTTVGFHLSSLYSPVGWMSWADIARAWEAAQQTGVEALKTFKNTVLAEPWIERGDAPDWERLLERREPYRMGWVPRGAVVLTADVDVQAQPARVEMSVWAWGPGFESWLVDHKVFDGSPADPEPWEEFAKALNQQWPAEEGGTMKIARVGVDTGGLNTQGVYVQLRRLHDPRIMPLKGLGGWNRAAPVNGPTLVDVTDKGRKLTRGLRLWTVAVDGMKSDLYGRLHKTRGDADEFPPGYVHLPEGIDSEFIKQLCAEQLITKKTRTGFSRMEWVKQRPNEALDTAVYARAALSVLGADRYGDRFWTRFQRKDAAPTPAPAPAPAPVPRAVPTPSPTPPVYRPGPQIITAGQQAAATPRRFGLNRMAGA